MRKLSLKTYSVYMMKQTCEEHCLKIKIMFQEVEEGNRRLLAPLATWLYLTEKRTLETGKELRKVLKDMFEKYPEISEENALMYLENSDDEDLNKFYNSFISQNLRRDETEYKNRMRKMINIIKDEKHLSNYKICKLCRVDNGNFHSFMQLERNDRISSKKLSMILRICHDL